MTTPLAHLFSELSAGASARGEAFILNSGDEGLLASLDKLSAPDASRSSNDGATIAAHAQHVRYGLSLMNKWARERGNPFVDAKWDEAWKTKTVDDRQWSEIRSGLRDEVRRWQEVLASPPTDLAEPEVLGIYASVAHLAYHLGAMRQISKAMRGPKEGTFRAS